MGDLRHWQYRIFALTWLSYASFYLCRKNLSVLLPALESQLGFSKSDNAQLVFWYSVAYAVGQIVMGTLSDRYGGRRVVAAGMLVSAVANLGMGFVPDLRLLMVLQFVNGMAQACGWSGLVRIMTFWFVQRTRGRVMGWWCTNYVLGGALATTFATYVATMALWSEWGYRRGFWIPGVVLAVVGMVFLLLVRDRPEEEGFAAHAEIALVEKSSLGFGPMLEIARIPGVQLLASVYFLVKMTRYAFLFWLPTYLVDRLQYTQRDAGNLSSVYEWVALVAAPLAGYLSDRVFGSRRAPVAALMLAGLALACLLPPVVAPLGIWGVVVSIGLIGIMTFGPDTLIGGAAVQDAVPRHLSASAAGLVNGVGSTGQVLSPLIVSYVVQAWGWDALFRVFVVAATLGALLLATRWNERRQEAQVYA